ncbi:MAG: rRNA maturation RNase YbeY [Candidatus Zambryskibacteria bacterium CG_4_9_14_3_um_filter_40_16]|uniref:Endoribonuclease YbeY n=2 Tax=Candidatus Zambryskiibacteriota TaxID=1817925 RepID=A0A2H0K788_9BACT|nr:MAG: rRNA maturation RNase YbeY [Candidatus Zambryskibacteria bacterium CG11_big_fil_rev_8_21_14_0_20_40_24]PJA33642.1 MAG: rRNA maturation RNase YbeY [Candidatus Zambryskibacteria bacterium CG_4_9_14_3_um_filter_40_16]
MAKEDSENFSITNKTKGKHPSLPFVKIKNEILGRKFDLSLVFIGNNLSRKLNRIYRGKDKSANILSFHLTKNSGEIFINLAVSKIEAKKQGESFRNYVWFILIHGMLHLKGMRHGSKMNIAERKFRIKFDL